MGADIWS